MKKYRGADESLFDLMKVQRELESLIDDQFSGIVWLIFAEDDIVGYAILTFGFSLKKGGRLAVIDELFIDPRSMDTDAADDAILFIEQQAKCLGARVLIFEFGESNSEYSNLLDRRGYKNTSVRSVVKVL